MPLFDLAEADVLWRSLRGVLVMHNVFTSQVYLERLRDKYCAQLEQQLGSEFDFEWEARENAVKKYVYFGGEQDVYSQLHKSVFYVNGETFTCAEQYMMYKQAGNDFLFDLKLVY